MTMPRGSSRPLIGVLTALMLVTRAGPALGSPPFSFVDADNDGIFTEFVDVPLLGGEVTDGFFDTRRAEGSYTQPIPGAGLVIAGTPLSTGGDIKLVADGNLKIDTDMTANGDIELLSRTGAVELDDPTISAADDIEIEAELDIVSTDDVLQAVGPGSEVELKAGRDIVLLGTEVQGDREVELKAADCIIVGDSKLPSPGSLTANDLNRGKVKLKAGSDIDLNGAEIDAGKEVEVKSSGGIFAVGSSIQALGSPRSEVELKAAGDIFADQGEVFASKDVELKSTRGGVSTNGASIEALGSSRGGIELKAADDILVDGGMLQARKEIELKSTGGSIFATAAGLNGIDAKSKIALKAPDDIVVDAATLVASREVELKARGGISAHQSMVFAPDARGDIEIKASDDIAVMEAILDAGDDIELRSADASIDATGAFFTADELELKADLDVAYCIKTVIADEIKVKNGGSVNADACAVC